MEQGTINIRIWIKSTSINVDSISQMLGVTPTASHSMGASRGKSGAVFNEHHWDYESGHREELSAWQEAKAMLAFIQERRSAFKLLRDSGASMGFNVTFKTGDYNLGFVLENSELEQLAESGFLLDLDVY